MIKHRRLSTGDAPDGRLRHLRRDAEENRDRILKSAHELFAAKGLGVTLDDVAHHARLGVGTVYRRFPNKESLVEALFEQRIIELIDIARKSLAFEDGWEGFLYLMLNMLTLEAENRGLRDVILGSEYLKQRLTDLKAEVGPPIEELIAKAQEQGSLRPDFRANDVPVLMAMAGAAQEYCGLVSPEIWKRYVAILIDGLKSNRESLTSMPESALDSDQLHQAMVQWKTRRHQ
ncbi:MAG: TetR/AcrR family transcriptional regulator [Acidimicrobiaceae bacterium]|nr:TetR/AcrR family transcriptional regulator [Acidimicrobiaceae bacterium]